MVVGMAGSGCRGEWLQGRAKDLSGLMKIFYILLGMWVM